MAKVASVGSTIGGVPYGGTVAPGDLVGWSSNKLVQASGAAGGNIPAVGVSAAAYKSGDTGAMHLKAEVSGLSGLTVGAVQYLSASAPGEVQEAVPATSGQWKQIVGFAVAADRVAIVFQDAGIQVA